MVRTRSSTPAELIAAAPGDYFYLDTPTHRWFATGVAARVVIDRDAVHVWTATTSDVEPWVDPLRQVVDLLNSAVGGALGGSGGGGGAGGAGGCPDWRAFGWAEPELGHALAGRPDLVGGDQPLLHLVVPTRMVDVTPSLSVAGTGPIAAFRLGCTTREVSDGHHVATGFRSFPSLVGECAGAIFTLDSRTGLADVIRIG
ncbi:hypothetical protein [Actinokineospora diospyrosa]|uniref:Uncharacterized protein n=1 Tax=Actinokineospora diospyrosa TaxID=103728 RepID=A0ABT1IGZ1_9PSEU|nr:hypothetical protein [Actinokineospora diospyrosa]MCP2271915.1 hypothetical protein [Actinokineospora diospyrosa]